jgi:hypothetical protein
MRHYRSSIPKEARERITATFLRSPKKFKAECRLNGVVVGVRYFHPTGDLSIEFPLLNGLTHGIVYRSEIPGMLASSEPFFAGLPHGTARQWSDEGKLIGTYSMRHGTGIDLWRCEHSETGLPYVSEVRYVKDGKWHGFEWWLDERGRVTHERHFSDDHLHGIERLWNPEGRLRRGYPKYWVKSMPVTKRQYERACAADSTLPLFLEKGNRPRRKFPPEILPHLR